MRRASYVLSCCLVMFLFSGSVGVRATQPEGVPPDFVAGLQGIQEVPIRVTDASGQAQFHLNSTSTTLSYRLIVEDIENVVASHIHLAPRGQNGPVVAFLFGAVPPGGGPVDGQIASGVITAADLRGPLMGQAFSVLVEALRTGGAYVNVHTNDGFEPVNSGPGDFPGGEIRGQIKRAGDRRLVSTGE